MSNSIDTVKKVYEYLDTVTPLGYDCGVLCDKKCCKGNNTDGMLLFPGEKEIFEKMNDCNIFFDKRYNSYCISCQGICNRDLRPLSCRIFPYFFYLNDGGKISVAPDIRAIDFCPIVANKMDVDKKFLRALRISALKLSEDAAEIEFIKNISFLLSDFPEF